MEMFFLPKSSLHIHGGYWSAYKICGSTYVLGRIQQNVELPAIF